MFANNMEYKGFIAKLKFDNLKAMYIAKVVNSDDTIICNGKSPIELKKYLAYSVDLYLDLCRKKGLKPNLVLP